MFPKKAENRLLICYVRLLAKKQCPDIVTDYDESRYGMVNLH
jgi:hypothetical protein